MNLIKLFAGIALVAGLNAHAADEPFVGCHIAMKEGNNTKIAWVQTQMEEGSTLPNATINREAKASGIAQGIVPLQLTDGRNVNFSTRFAVDFTGRFDFVGAPLFKYQLDLKIADGSGPAKPLFTDSSFVGLYIPGYLVLNKSDLSLKRMELSNGVPTPQEDANDLTITFFCDPVTIQH